jgi:hypothetical protein
LRLPRLVNYLVSFLLVGVEFAHSEMQHSGLKADYRDFSVRRWLGSESLDEGPKVKGLLALHHPDAINSTLN